MRTFIKAAAALVVCTGVYFAGAHYVHEAAEAREEKLEQDGVDRATYQRVMMTRDPLTGEVPTGRLLQANQLRSALLATARTSAIGWTERGPRTVGGRTRAAFVDSRDASGNTVFAASVSGGIWKTTNFLSVNPTWTPVDEKMANLAVTCMWQSQTNPSIMYAGTGEGFFNYDAIRGAGVFRSTDGGTTWAQLPSTATFEYIQDLVVDNNGNIYVSLRNAATNFRGVQRSTDGGTTWTQVLGLPLTTLPFATGRACDLEVASNGDLYATLGIFTRGMVLKSAATNGANTGSDGTWVDITPTFSDITQRTEIAVAPSNPQRLYCMGQDSATQTVTEFFRSDNGGASWVSTAIPDGVNSGAPQTWYNLCLAVDPSNPDIVVAGGLNISRSLNGGGSWSTISAGVHVDQHLLLYAASSRLIAGNDGGIYMTQNPTVVSPTWANKNNNYNVTQFYGADFHPTQPDYFLAGAQDNNTHQFNSPGINEANSVISGDGAIPHIDQTDGNLQIGAYVGNTYFRSLNGGVSFSAIANNNQNTGQFINPSDLDDAGKVLYGGDAAGKLHVITNLTGSPSRAVRSITAMGTRSVSAVRVDASAANTVWIGCSGGAVGTTANRPQVIKLTSANTASPTVAVSTVLSAIPGGAWISSIEIDPANANRILVTLSNYGVVSILESTDGGVTFNAIEGNLPDMPVYWALVLPNNVLPIDVNGGSGGGILVGTDLGIWYTTQANGTSTSWQPYANFPNTPVWQLKYRPANQMVVAATHGRGLWTGRMPLATGVSNVTATRDFIRYISSANSRLTIVPGSLNLRRMNVEVYDNKGALLLRESRAYQAAQLPIDRFAHGVYTVRITGDKGEIFVQQIVR